MKKFLLCFNFIGIFLLLILSSCNDDRIHNPNTNFYHDNPSYLASSNPLDSIGVYHNELVDYYKCVYQENVTNRFYYHDSTSYMTRAAYNNLLASFRDYSVNVLHIDSLDVEDTISELLDFNNNYGLDTIINGNEYVRILKNYSNAIEYWHNLGYFDNQTYSTISSLYINQISIYFM